MPLAALLDPSGPPTQKSRTHLFFDPERWSEAYEHQKQCGFVFTPRSRVPLVALASRIMFYEYFGVVMDQQADRAAKVPTSLTTSG